MNLKKRASKSIVLALIGIMTITPILNTASAMEKIEDNIISELKIENDKNEIDKDYIESQLSDIGVELVKLPETRSNKNLKTLDFETEDEFIKFIRNFKTEDELENSLIQSRISDLGHLKWYAPFSGFGMTGIANWKNIKFKYDYSKNKKGVKTINKISNINSDISGIHIAVSWHQQNATSNIASNKRSANFKVSGYYLLGVTIGGAPIGAKLNSTWTRTFKI